MIIVRLKGGLGNQLFQYALGRNIAINNQTVLYLDISEYQTYKLHEFSLSKFNIHADFFNDESEKNLIKRDFFDNIRNYFMKDSYAIIKEKNFEYDESILKLKGNYYLEGYWQSEKYFKGIETLLHDEFSVKSPPDEVNNSLLTKIKNCNSVSIHIRRGDYVTDPQTKNIHGTLSLDYYEKAISLIQENEKKCLFFIFSDDPVWVKNAFSSQEIEKIFISHNNKSTNHEDFRLMSNCKHNIIANSTFSWWAAWLNDNANKTIIAPAKWFASDNLPTGDLIPKTWIQI